MPIGRMVISKYRKGLGVTSSLLAPGGVVIESNYSGGRGSVSIGANDESW